MKIKNEYIKIKTGNKIKTLQNYIYYDYLVPYSKTQYEIDDPIDLIIEQGKKKLTECYIRFDTPIANIKNATKNDFQVLIYLNREDFSGHENLINLTYEYDLNNGTNLDSTIFNIEDYYGKKVTALGFGNMNTIYACLDVSNYDIYVLEDEGFYITRKDVISSEAKCYDYDFLVHLSPIGDMKNAEYNSVSRRYEPLYAKIYSIGLSKTVGVLDEEYVIGEDIDIKVESDTSFGFYLLKGEDESIYPQNNLYTLDNIYPLPPYIKEELYPRDTLFPRNDLFARDSNYKYIFYKFRLYKIHWNGIDPNTGYYEIQWLDKYYTMFLKNNTKGLFEIVTKIERSDD